MAVNTVNTALVQNDLCKGEDPAYWYSQVLPGLALILYKCQHIPKLGKHKTFKPTGKNEAAVNALAALWWIEMCPLIAPECCQLLLKHSLALGNDGLVCGGKNLQRLGGNGDPLSVWLKQSFCDKQNIFLFVEDETVPFLYHVWHICPLCCSPVWVEWTLLLGMPFGATCFQSRLWWARISWQAARIQTSCMNW